MMDPFFRSGFIRLRLNTLSRFQRDCWDDRSSPKASTRHEGKANRADLSRRSLDEVGSSLERRRVRLRRNSALIPRPAMAGLRGASFVGFVCIINTDPASVFVINDLKPFYFECADHIIFRVFNY